ncbi:hypothetical protein JW721_03765 [Candidatus Micrarchaeota archaeon]|nr:hypothetical protein [Candidatus Micrarchaeota archaeon]
MALSARKKQGGVGEQTKTSDNPVRLLENVKAATGEDLNEAQILNDAQLWEQYLNPSQERIEEEKSKLYSNLADAGFSTEDASRISEQYGRLRAKAAKGSLSNEELSALSQIAGVAKEAKESAANTSEERATALVSLWSQAQSKTADTSYYDSEAIKMRDIFYAMLTESNPNQQKINELAKNDESVRSVFMMDASFARELYSKGTSADKVWQALIQRQQETTTAFMKDGANSKLLHDAEIEDLRAVLGEQRNDANQRIGYIEAGDYASLGKMDEINRMYSNDVVLRMQNKLGLASESGNFTDFQMAQMQSVLADVALIMSNASPLGAVEEDSSAEVGIATLDSFINEQQRAMDETQTLQSLDEQVSELMALARETVSGGVLTEEAQEKLGELGLPMGANSADAEKFVRGARERANEEISRVQELRSVQNGGAYEVSAFYSEERALETIDSVKSIIREAPTEFSILAAEEFKGDELINIGTVEEVLGQADFGNAKSPETVVLTALSNPNDSGMREKMEQVLSNPFNVGIREALLEAYARAASELSQKRISAG